MDKNALEENAGAPRVLALMGYDSLFGAERANVQVLKLLRDQGIRIECIVRENEAPQLVSLLESEGFGTHQAKFGPSLFGLQKNPWHYVRNLIGMLRVSCVMRKTAQSFRPTHIYIPNYIQFLYALFAIIAMRKPVVFRIGDPPETTSLHRILWSRVIAPKVTAFATNSEFTRQRLLTAVGKPCNSRVIQNCTTRQNASMTTEGSQMAPAIVTYLGQFNPSKGVHLAVDAAIEICKKREDVVFQFVGLTDPLQPYSSELIRKVEIAKLNSRIFFIEFQNEVQSLLARTSLHLCPSLQEESSANVVIEAKQAGVPSVVFPRGGLPELVRHEVDGFVTETPDAAGLVRGILFFLSSPERLYNARIAARESLSRYLPEKVAPLWKNVFIEVAIESGSVGRS